MAKDLEMGYLLDFYGEVLTPNSGRCCASITTMTFRSARLVKFWHHPARRPGCHQAWGDSPAAAGRKVGFAARYRRVQSTLEQLEQLVIDTRFECTGPACIHHHWYAAALTKMLELIRSIDEANES